MDQRGTTEDNNWQDRLTDYLFGGMPSADAAEFERQLDECRAHVVLAQEYSEVVGWLGTAVPPAEPPKGHKERLLARIASTQQEAVSGAPEAGIRALPTAREEAAPARVADITEYRERRRQAGVALPLIAAAAAAILLFVGLWAWDAQNRANIRESEVRALQARVAQIEQDLNQAKQNLNIPPGYVAFPVQGQESFTATATIFFNPDTNQAYLFANGLQPLAANQVYEFWLLSPQHPNVPPTPAGTFRPDAAGGARHTVEAPSRLRDYAGVAVSIEEAPGKPAPEGPIVMVGLYSVP